jgi:hypothetical protein
MGLVAALVLLLLQFVHNVYSRPNLQLQASRTAVWERRVGVPTKSHGVNSLVYELSAEAQGLTSCRKLAPDIISAWLVR